ncbi:MAG TPA: hypothetical protein VIL37_15885 [Natronosporangium sp.]
MTEPTPATRPDEPPAPAIAAVSGRIFLLDKPEFIRRVPEFLSPDRSGLAASGKGGIMKIDALRPYATSPLLCDPAAYLDQVATPKEPFALPDDDGALFGTGLDDVLQGQRQCGAAAAITPTCYVQEGDLAALNALADAAAAIDRDDVIVAVPVALPWLTEQRYLSRLIACLQRIPHPKAVMFGAQWNPFNYASAHANFRRLLAETTNVGLWRADVLAAFDCMAYGGAFAVIGAGGSLRHLVPPEVRARASNWGAHKPAVLLPAMLRYVQADVIADRYANTPAPRCDCPVCEGRPLDRFDSLDQETRAEAHDHNAAVWTGWLPDLFGHATDADRRRWWRGLCQAAVDAHQLENLRLGQKDAFKVSTSLRKLAELPLA